jgi:drug/metabolite transporter (DMT)-like permease
MSTYLILALLVTTQVLGDIWLSRGMKPFSELDSFSGLVFLHLIAYLFTNPWIWLGILTLICALLLYLSAISHLDLSYVLPMRASGYILNALLAWLILHEHISGVRWLATGAIAIRVFIMGWSEHRNASASETLAVELSESDINSHSFYSFAVFA